MMHDPEIEHRVVALVRGADGRPQIRDVAVHQPDPLAMSGQPPPGPVEQPGVQVNRIDMLGSEASHDQVRAVAAAAAELENMQPSSRPAEAEKDRRLVPALQGPACGGVAYGTNRVRMPIRLRDDQSARAFLGRAIGR